MPEKVKDYLYSSKIMGAVDQMELDSNGDKKNTCRFQSFRSGTVNR